ncbi:MAG TPA: ABC transporter substrate-binding protein [Actinomycetota bacterium]|jgi:ABC-type transport system substrate-binding protein/class 3 adenylate cyclase|nr:ABC transporter substrate-binding protein [Actinomycetota bacterium]
MSEDVGDLREERRVVTALFADLVGSTALGERLDAEELKLILADAIARVIGAVEAFGGTVKDLAGDGVLALFGAPIAHEDDPERAVRAGLRIVDEIAEFAGEVERGWGIEGFGIRVGVDTGPVVTGAIGAGSRVEYSALGDAVNTAARLQSHAEPGTLLAGEKTYRLAQQLFDWAEPVELELKGKAQPARAWQVTGTRAAAGRTRGLEGVQARMVGRERELAAGVESVDAAVTGSGGILFLVGEPGIGKSRLLAELRTAFESAKPHHGTPLWLEGRCVSYGESMPYLPFRDLLRSWLGAASDDPELRVRIALRRHTSRLFGDRSEDVEPYLASLLGLSLESEASARLEELAPEALQYRTFEVVRALVGRLAEDGPVAVAIEDLHWVDATSLQLLERLLSDTEVSALLLVLTTRPERDHPSWRVKELAARDLPHRTRELALEALPGDAGRELLHALVGAGTMPADMEGRILRPAEGNPFFLEELVRSLVDAGALVRADDEWRFEHTVDVEIPPTVEKVILARIDRLQPSAHDALMAASVLGRQFGLPLLEAVIGGNGEVRQALTDLQRVDLLREGRRWPEPEYRFNHALIQEAAYRTLVTDERNRLHRKAAEWLEDRYATREDEVAGLLAHHWLGADDEDKAVRYLTRAGDSARQEYALDEAISHYRELLTILERRGERREMALVLFKLALALHVSLRFAEANEAYQRAFEYWERPSASAEPTATIAVATSFLPNDPDPRSAIAWPNIQLCMQLFDRLVEQWPERTIVPSLAERWEISDDGLRYVFHLREGLTWSDGEPLTAHDVEFGIKRVLNPDAPGSSVAIYFVLENGQDYYLRRNADRDRIGVRALDDRTVEFRLVAPAPYFMSVMNRPDGGPQPRHAIEAPGASWIETGKQVVSGPFRIVERTDDMLVLARRDGDAGPRPGNVHEVRFLRSAISDALGPYRKDDLDLILVRYTPKLADLVPGDIPDDVSLGPAAWSAYLRFDHTHPAMSNLELRRALAHAVDREALAAACPANLVVATGGVVPPALQGHTPEIAPRFDPDLARRHLERSGFTGELELAGMEVWDEILEVVAAGWQKVFGSGVSMRTWSWRAEEAMQAGGRPDSAPLRITGWFPGYADPEYFLRLLFQSDSRTNEGGFSDAAFDELIDRARRERRDRERLELFHEADRMAVADQVACIPLVYGRNVAYVKPWLKGWWEFGKTSSSFADLIVEPSSPRTTGSPSPRLAP